MTSLPPLEKQFVPELELRKLCLEVLDINPC
jgi:hypothetical protein